MSSALSLSAVVFVPGEVLFAEAIDFAERLAHAESVGLLAVELPALGPAARGRLAVAVEEAIEGALVRRGACAPGVGAATSLGASLSDQLYRARLLELRGLALGIHSLAGITDLAGALDPDDGRTLRFLLRAADEAPVKIILASDNAEIGMYGPPQPLASFVSQVESRVESEPAPAVIAPEVAASAGTMELSEPPPAVVERDGALAFTGDLEDTQDDEETAEISALCSTPAATPPAELAAAAPSSPLPIGDLADALLKTLASGELTPPPVVIERKPAPGPAPVEQERLVDASALKVPPLYPNAEHEWRGWLADLQATRGPRPLAVIERMFVTSYVPLCYALSHGLCDESARRAVETWSSSFSQSYREAFDALRVRGKRPSMVLDTPDLALRIGRLHGARTISLLLIDGMRFDLGLRVEQRVRGLIGQQAALTERLLLWSALPSTTEAQLELLGRGPEGLKEDLSGPLSEIPVARGRSATTLRRVKTGHRELFKLDVVEARLGEPGAAEGERLDHLADETATLLADHLLRQAPRTLVFAFGDHGFQLEPREGGTRSAKSGGSSPEEVLVPAFAWLVGGVH